MSKYKPTIGIECHVQLATKTKLFSGVDNDARDKSPNSCVSPVDYALPGMLPVLNRAAVELAVRAGLAMNCKINLVSRFDRKHYYYPDLPKGYQISQMYMPIIGAGEISLSDGSTVKIEHAHLEEDAGKLTHYGSYSLVDLNRAGTPLVEIVSMPDIHSAEQARLYCEELHKLMVYSGASYGDLYHGNMRFDVNISVSDSDKLGTRTEIKNLNSFRSVERAAIYEFNRQVELLEKGEKIKQETRGWSDAKGKTTSQRSKEEAQDYRYMPEPDIPPIRLDQEFVTAIGESMPTLPGAYRKAFGSFISSEVVETLLNHRPIIEKLHEVLIASSPSVTNKIANIFSSTLLAEENSSLLNDPLPSTNNLLELANMIDKGELSSTAAKQIFIKFYDSDMREKTTRTIAKELNLLQENDESALEKIIDEVIALPECQQAVNDVKNGEMKAIGFLVGQIMRRSAGKANPATAKTLLTKKLS